ncbi:AAA family ATPase [Laceyella putida]|uniref:AAA family ATPase n=1 Tax=Laceyella putida TaxID=110101 RepID=A0ABW2RKN4_9BACL
MTTEESNRFSWDEGHPLVNKLVENIEKVLVGKKEAIRLSIAALLAQGHVLLEDVPGVGKTMLVKALARSLGCQFRRIQFTPDLLPSDVVGVSIFNQKTLDFEYRPGPLMSQVVLADEINRTSPRTQAALLEALEEGNVTVDGHTYPLPSPFFVMATQNPIEYEGTFPLPEAQLDRFLIKLRLGYPCQTEEVEMLKRIQLGHPLIELEQVWTEADLLKLQTEVPRVKVEPSLTQFIVQVVGATRNHEDIYLGASPRASLAVFRASQAWALIQGRDYVLPDDIVFLLPHVLEHRLLLHTEARLQGKSASRLITQLLQGIPVPIAPK